jgi:hypothetical protein
VTEDLRPLAPPAVRAPGLRQIEPEVEQGIAARRDLAWQNTGASSPCNSSRRLSSQRPSPTMAALTLTTPGSPRPCRRYITNRDCSTGQPLAPSGCARDWAYAIVPRSRGNIKRYTRHNTVPRRKYRWLILPVYTVACPYFGEVVGLDKAKASNCQILWIFGGSECLEPAIEGYEVIVGEALRRWNVME